MSYPVDDVVPLSSCVSLDDIFVSPEAWAFASEFSKEFQNPSSSAAGVVAFVWCEGRKWRSDRNAEWKNQGAGLELGMYKASQIPDEAVHVRDGAKYAFLIPSEILKRSQMRLIDIEEKGCSKVLDLK
ncbi:MAG: hypothetical protein ACHQAY_11445 [Hyphomicrobiales bacterium]